MNATIFALSTALILALFALFVLGRKYRSLVRDYYELDEACDANTVKLRDLKTDVAALRKQVQIDLAQQPSGYEVERWTLKGPGETAPRLVYRNLFKEPETAESVARSLDFENSKHPGTVSITPLFKR